MKFRLVEDLEQDLQAAAAEREAVRKQIANMFKNTEFKEKKNINGISWNATRDKIEASFYIDDALSYNGYVYDGAEYNLQVEGDIETAVDSAANVLEQFEGLEVDKEVEEVEDELE